MATSVFVSYRRDDTKHAAGRLGERLDRRFQLFMDVDNIRPGLDFTAAVRTAVDRADIMLALIGPAWLTSTDEAGARRIDNQDDWVVLEIGTALQRGIPVIPVLVDGAQMPRRDQLPTSLTELATRQAIKVAHESFAADCLRLIETIETAVNVQGTPDVDLWADPDYPEGLSASLQEQWDKAIEAFERTLRRHPRQQVVIDQLEEARRRRDTVALDEKANRAASEGQWAVAVEALEAMAALQPSDEVARRLREAKKQRQVLTLQRAIRALASRGDWRGVIAADAELSALDPKAADFDGLASHARDQDLEARLSGEYSQAVQQIGSKEWENAESTLAALLEKRPSYRDAEDLLELARRRGQRPIENTIELASAHTRANQMPDTRERSDGADHVPHVEASPLDPTREPPSRDEPVPRRRTARLVAILVPMVAVVLLVGSYLIFTSNDDPTGPDARTEAETTPVTCWDGSEASQLDECGRPTGEAGLAWVFPSLAHHQDCVNNSQPDKPRLTVLACVDELSDGSRVQLTYSQWRTVGDGLDYYNRDDMDRTDVTDSSGSALYQWVGKDVDGRFKAARLYALEPYSAAVYVPQPDQRLEALESLVTMRPLDEVRGIPAE